MTVNDKPSPLQPGYHSTLTDRCFALMITRSDNVATNMLYDILGRERATQIVQQRYGLTGTAFYRRLSGSLPLIHDPQWDGIAPRHASRNGCSRNYSNSSRATAFRSHARCAKRSTVRSGTTNSRRDCCPAIASRTKRRHRRGDARRRHSGYGARRVVRDRGVYRHGIHRRQQRKVRPLHERPPPATLSGLNRMPKTSGKARNIRAYDTRKSDLSSSSLSKDPERVEGHARRRVMLLRLRCSDTRL